LKNYFSVVTIILMPDLFVVADWIEIFICVFLAPSL
jgi:hypothetical protein